MRPPDPGRPRRRTAGQRAADDANSIQVFAGNASTGLADAICAHLGVARGRAEIRRFSDGEIFVEIHENVRGADVFVVQSTSSPGNDNLMELLLMLDALKRASAGRVTAVHSVLRIRPPGPQGRAPRADQREARGRPDRHRRRVARDDDGTARRPDPGLLQRSRGQPLLESGAAAAHFASRLRDCRSPSSRPTPAAWSAPAPIAKRLDATLAIIDKRRVRANQVEEMRIIGDVDRLRRRHHRRHDRHRRHRLRRGHRDHRGRRQARAGLHDPRSSLGTGGGADHRLESRHGHHDRHHRPLRGSADEPEDPRRFGGAASSRKRSGAPTRKSPSAPCSSERPSVAR